MEILNIGLFATAVGVLVILTNAFTELLKGIFPKIPPQILATVIALLLTIFAATAYLSITGAPVHWYVIVGSLVAGLFVSYTAQFGHDKLDEIIKILGGKK